jgi:hypothetical protein
MPDHAVRSAGSIGPLATALLTCTLAVHAQSTAVMTGQVTNALSGEPVPAAIVHLRRVGGSDRIVHADDTGRFAAAELAAGTYHVEGAASGFFAGAVGQTTYGGADRTVVVDDQTRVADVAVPVWPPGIIRGVVRDMGGASVAGRVFLLRRPVDGWEGPWRPWDGARPVATDAAGRYALGGLEPGLYVVAAQAAAGPIAGSSFGVTFAPSAGRLADAVPVRVGSGDTAEDTDIAVQLRRPITVAGHLIGPPGLIGQASVRLCPPDEVTRTAGLCTRASQSGPDGRFSLADVVPGAYLIEAVTPGGATDPGPIGWGRRAAVFGNADVDNADVPMAPTITLAGQVRVPSGRALPAEATVSVGVLDPLLVPFTDGADPSIKTAVGRDGRFMFAGLLPGEYLFVDRSGAPGLTLVSADLGAQDGADEPFTVSNDLQWPDVTVTLAEASGLVYGTARLPEGDPRPETTVLLFSTEPRFWHPMSRRVRSGRTAADGTYGFADLPEGDYYLVATPGPLPALSAAVLEGLLAGSRPIHVNMGQTVSADVTVR